MGESEESHPSTKEYESKSLRRRGKSFLSLENSMKIKEDLSLFIYTPNPSAQVIDEVTRPGLVHIYVYAFLVARLAMQ